MSSARNVMGIFFWYIPSFMWTLLHGDTLIKVIRYCMIMNASVWQVKVTSPEPLVPTGHLTGSQDMV
jgi:hypothetical protein